MIEVKNLTVAFDRNILEKLSVLIRNGEFCVLVGENGSGKSTFLRSLVGLIPLEEGMVSIAGLDPGREADLPKIRKTIGFLFQNPEDQLVAATVEEEVAFGLESLRLEESEIEKRIQNSLRLTNLAKKRFSPTQELSGGEKQRLALASLLAMKPDILLLDEPTSFLDRQSRRDLLQILKELKRAGTTIVMATQELEEVFWGERIFLLHAGKFFVFEDPSEFFSDLERLISLGLEIPYSIQLDFLLKDCSPLAREGRANGKYGVGGAV